ncbi:MAG: hypothetical protein KQJ78_11080 [Deltaproteobacteria bacterium]|nr:hypothetical protein [Deltaproteobacteria bacterium]
MSVIELDGREHPPETVWRAQELYCVCRLTYAQVAAELGVAASTLKRWGKAYDWAEKRANLAQAQCDIRADTILARSVMLKELIAGRHPLVGFAVAKLEELALKQAQAEREGRAQEAQAAAARQPITTKAEAAAAMQEAIERKLARLLADPGEVDLRAIKGIKDALALLDEMRPAKDSEGDAGKKGISAETLAKIQSQVLGL